MKVALMAEVAMQPMMRRTPVPEFPQSMTCSGSRNPPTPTPQTDQSPSPCRTTSAPKARIAAAVSRTSWPSRSPVTLVSPTAIAPRISARCEIDLSPGTSARPFRAPDLRAVIAMGSPWPDISLSSHIPALIAQAICGVHALHCGANIPRGCGGVKPPPPPSEPLKGQIMRHPALAQRLLLIAG